ncbi:MAG: SufD family Fe-S cluster assembly protein [Janthinobacterium lividum]
MTPLPTRRDEAWRYSDLAAVARVWPVAAPEVVIVPAGTTLTRDILQDAADGAVGIIQLDVTVEAGGRFDMTVLNLGGSYGRVALDVTLGDGAHFGLGGVILGRGEQTLEIVTTVRHAAPNATSHQTIRSVLDDRAAGSFLGKVAVARDAQKSDAVQSVKALLLSRSATANAKPELEIFADDVKCAHGATVGELNAQALFYLASRGVGPAEAKALLTEAFIADALTGNEAFAARAVDWLRSAA